MVEERLQNVLGQIGSKVWFPRQQNLPYVYNGENVVDMMVPPFVFGSSSKLQVTRTGIKSRTSSISGQIRLFTLELLAFERQNFSHRLIMEKMLWT